jgi:hypothetical protein
MISEERVEAAVEYLRDTAKPYGQARGRSLYTENNLRRVKALNMPCEGPIAERESKAYASEPYKMALEDMENAMAEAETIRALREAAAYTIEVWRSQSSARKQGANL